MRTEFREREVSNAWKSDCPPGEPGEAALFLVAGPERVRLEVSSSFAWRRDADRNVVVVEFTVP